MKPIKRSALRCWTKVGKGDTVKKFFILVGFLIALGFCSPAQAQVYDTKCPAGSSVAPGGTARNPANDHLKQNLCIDSTGSLVINGPETIVGPCTGTGCSSGGGTFDTIGSGTNTTAAMQIGTGASLGPTGSGALTANKLLPGGTLLNCMVWGSGGAPGDSGSPCLLAGPDDMYATAFGAKFDGHACLSTNVGVAATSTTVTCVGGNFSNVDVAKDIFITNGFGGIALNETGTVVLAKTTIVTVTNASTISVLNPAGGTCSSNANCWLIWGTNDDTALTALDAAILTHRNCPHVIFPAGMSLIAKAHFDSVSTTCQWKYPASSTSGIGTSTDYTLTFSGGGPGSTNFALEPSFDFTTCTAHQGTSSSAPTGVCFFGIDEVVLDNFGMMGGGNSATGSGAAHILVGAGIGSQFINVAFGGFGGADLNLTGVSAYDGLRTVFMSIDGFGGGAFVSNTDIATVINVNLWAFVGDSTGLFTSTTQALFECRSGNFIDYASEYGTTLGYRLVSVQSGCYYEGHGVTAFGLNATKNSGTGIDVIGTGVAMLHGGIWDNSSCPTDCNGAAVEGTGKMVAYGTTFKGKGAGHDVYNSATFTSYGAVYSTTTGGGTFLKASLVAGP